MPTYTSKGSSGDVLLACTMPEAEYMYGCTPTAAAMLLGYYDLYGYRGADLSNIVEGDVDLKSRGKDGVITDMDDFETALGRLTASEDFVYRFHARKGTATTPAQELAYSFNDDGSLKTDIWNCLADYLGTGQFWRGNENLSTTDSYCSLEQLYTYTHTVTIKFGKTSRTLLYYEKTMLYGLDLYVKSRGYELDREITGTYLTDTAGGDFTFADYMREIDAGRPVLISIKGHSMVGYGYNADTMEIIFDDCYNSGRRMAWNGTYEYNHSERQLQAITVIGINVNGDMDLAVSTVPGSGETVIVSDTENAPATPDVCFSGNSMNLTFAVSNLGSKDSGDFHVAVRIDGESAKTIPVESVAAKSDRTYTDIPLGELTIGLHNVCVILDESNEIQELAGSNNTASTDVLVLNPGTVVLSDTQTVGAGKMLHDRYVHGGTLNVAGSAADIVVRGRDANGESNSWLQRGRVTVSQGGIVSCMAVCDDGSATVSSGGNLRETSVYSNGSAIVCNGGTAAETTILSGGRLTVSSGGMLTGHLQLMEGASATVLDGGGVNFDLSSALPGADVYINDLSRLNGSPIYSLTVEGKLADGKYKLADGATEFSQSVSVMNTAGEELAVLKAGETVSIGTTDYMLNLSGGVLSFDVVTVQNFFSGDFDGTGKKMLARECGGAISIYADGASWGPGLTIDSDWSFAEVGDFNGDGKCDILRIHASGLLVGELSNGDGTFSPVILDRKGAGWSIVGTGDFNGNGEDDVLAANPTGISGNAGLLGFWDGGTEWDLFAGYYGQWKPVSTGDFNGDGTDDTLWRAAVTDETGTPCYGYCSWLLGLSAEAVEWNRIGALSINDWDFLATGDFNGDGTDDVAMIGANGNVNVCVLENGQLKTFSAEEREVGKSAWTQIGAIDTVEWTFAGAGDFNGDGTDDLAWCNNFTGVVEYWQIADNQVSATKALATIA